MRRLLAGLALVASLAHAQSLPPFQPIGAPAKASVTGTAQDVTLPTALSGSGRVSYLVVALGTQTVNYRCDGVVATTANGWEIGAGMAYLISLPASVTTCSVIATDVGSTISFTVGVGQ